MLFEALPRMSKIMQIGEMLARSWWVFSFAGFCFCAHLAAVHSHNLMLDRLNLLKDQRLTEQLYWTEQNEIWKMRLANCQNSAWLELVLMRELGVCPKKMTKVIFKESDESDEIKRATASP